MLQGAWELVAADKGSHLTVVAVGIARIGEAPVVAMNAGGRAFQGTGRALSAAAGRLSYTYSLKARTAFHPWQFAHIRSACYGLELACSLLCTFLRYINNTALHMFLHINADVIFM